MAKKKTTKARTSRTPATKASGSASKSRKSTTTKAAAKPAKATKAAETDAKKPLRLSQASTGKAGAKRIAPAASQPSNGQMHRNGDDAPALTEAQLRKVKTGLTKRDLQHYRQLLLEKRAEIFGDVTSMEGDINNSGGNLSSMPMHMADIGSDNYEQEFTLGLVESERKLIREIDDALMRIQKGIYGVCLESGVPIARPRLDAKPWAKYTIEVAREREKRGLM